jgi:hypothetical protein
MPNKEEESFESSTIPDFSHTLPAWLARVV